MQSFHAVHAFRKYVTKHASMKPEKVGMAGMQKKKKERASGLDAWFFRCAESTEQVPNLMSS